MAMPDEMYHVIALGILEGTVVKLEHSKEILSNTHHPSVCEGEPCPIHNMTDHSMREFPQHWRTDRKIMERMCPHGVGHPDPDCVYAQQDSTHGCDGCCN